MKRSILVLSLAALLLVGVASADITPLTQYRVTVVLSMDGKVIWKWVWIIETADSTITIMVPKALYDLIVEEFGTDTFTLPFSASWTVDEHTFTLDVTSDPPGLTVTFEPMGPGDINGDRIVDVFDATLLAAAFGNGPYSLSGYNAFADINVDGIVDVFDSVILSANYGRVY